jgi:hypothetical protein
MAHQVFFGYDYDTSKFVEVDGDFSTSHSGVGNNSSLGLSVFSHSESVDWASSISGPSVTSD